MRNSELMTGFARTHFIYVFAAANRRERCPQRSVKYGQVFGGLWSSRPTLRVLLIIVFRETARGRRDWDDVGIVPYKMPP